MGAASELESSIHLTLRDSKTLNVIAYDLEPERAEYRSEVHGLPIKPSYPGELKFRAASYQGLARSCLCISATAPRTSSVRAA